MSSTSMLLLAAALCFSSLGCLASPARDCASNCPTSNTALDRMYRYFNCTPQTSAACPECTESYSCPEIVSPPEDHCLSNGKLYKPGDDMPSDNPCKLHCRCSIGGRISCASVEFCPQMSLDEHNKGCYFGYEDEHSCCAKIECPSEGAAAEEQITCEFEGKKYHKNERFYTACKRCVCDASYDPANPLKSCHEMSCGYDESRIQAGCAIVSSNTSCCPYYYYCPATKAQREEICGTEKSVGACSQEIPSYYYDAGSKTCKKFLYSGCAGGPNRFNSETECLHFCNNEAANETPEAGKCHFNGANYAIGDLVPTEDPYIECRCSMPPYINCINKN